MHLNLVVFLHSDNEMWPRLKQIPQCGSAAVHRQCDKLKAKLKAGVGVEAFVHTIAPNHFPFSDCTHPCSSLSTDLLL